MDVFASFCLLTIFFFFKQKTAYDMRISDWSSDVCSSDLSRLFRWAERQLLKRSDLLVVSSPGFDRHYFRSVQGYRGRLFLLENKISFAQASAVARPRPDVAAAGAPPAAPQKWVIGWFGTLRCRKRLAMLCRIAAALPDKVEIYLRGVPTETDRKSVV